MSFPGLMAPPIGGLDPRLQDILRRIASTANGTRVFWRPGPRTQMDLDTLHAGALISLTGWGDGGLEATIRDRGLRAIGMRRAA